MVNIDNYVKFLDVITLFLKNVNLLLIRSKDTSKSLGFRNIKGD